MKQPPCYPGPPQGRRADGARPAGSGRADARTLSGMNCLASLSIALAAALAGTYAHAQPADGGASAPTQAPGAAPAPALPPPAPPAAAPAGWLPPAPPTGGWGPVSPSVEMLPPLPPVPTREPRTEREWREGKRALEMRLLMANEHEKFAQAIGDEAREDFAERQVSEAKEDLESYEDRTTHHPAAAIAIGSSLAAAGVIAIAVGTVNARDQGGPGGERPGWQTWGLGVGGGLFLATGVLIIAAGARRGWKGPPDDGPSATLHVGPRSVSLDGVF